MPMRTAEHVSKGHPDKFADQFVDAVLDEMLTLAKKAGTGDARNKPDWQRAAFEVAAKDRLIVITGEARMGPAVYAALDVRSICKKVWTDVGYEDADSISVVNHIQVQSPELSKSADREGAGDQGIMVGYATNETATKMPLEYELARTLNRQIYDLRAAHPWIKADSKTQVTLDENGKPVRIVIAVQHDKSVVCLKPDGEPDDDKTCALIKERLMPLAVAPIFGATFDPAAVTVNGTGSFVIGGTIGDAGVVGRKIVVDAYGPRVPVGGGAYSGKDPTKVDRSAAYMARHIAKTAVHLGIRGAQSALVHIAFGIGKIEPEMVTAVTGEGVDISDWVHSRFNKLSPRAITEHLDLWRMNDESQWRYQDTAGFGHYGRDEFPWEKIADVPA